MMINKKRVSADYVYKIMHSPVGNLRLIASEKGLAAILWQEDDPNRVPLLAERQEGDHPVLCEAERQLREYFAGKRQSFNLRLDFNGTAFQKQVWEVLLTIPYGETRSYGQIARQLHRPKAARAVGAANRKNPISIIAACHRVIGASGALTGFAGGIKAKAFLLKLENQQAKREK